ncbi:MAG: glycosyltransferase family 2 protein [Anaerolineae bacterium]|nr:MAG: glycosyltransferase family 2 protein [Anaerolineae bacterium]
MILPTNTAQDESRKRGLISISVVSHAQTKLVSRLLSSLERYETDLDYELILLENLPGALDQDWSALDHPVKFVANDKAQGLARNWNATFTLSRGEYFCLLNPDLVFVEPVFASLLENIHRGGADIVAPTVYDASGRLQSSARELPSAWSLLMRRMSRGYAELEDLELLPSEPDWIAGMFLLMRSEVYQELGGMNERYYLYFEDVDFCTRARFAGHQLFLDKRVKVVHDAQRSSRRHPKYLAWHAASALRFLSSPAYRRARKQGA